MMLPLQHTDLYVYKYAFFFIQRNKIRFAYYKYEKFIGSTHTACMFTLNIVTTLTLRVL